MLRAVLTLLALTAPAAAQVVGDLPSPPTQHWFALDLDFGVAYDHALAGAHYEQRVRAGMSWLSGWKFWNLVATAETLDFDRYAFGVQADMLAIHSAIGAYAGPSVTTHGGVDITAGVGWNIFFVEVQGLDLNTSPSFMVSGVLRIPIGALSYALWGPRPVVTIPAPHAAR